MTNITFLEVDKEDQSLVRGRFPDATITDAALNNKELIKACKDGEVVSCFINTRFCKEIIMELPKLKLLCTRSVGYDHIDAEACRQSGIIVCNVPDYGSHVIAEHVFALLLSTLRHIHEGEKRVEGGTFDYHGLRGMALRGKTLGIIGTGKIGRKVAEIAHGFGMMILAVDQCRTMELVDLLGVKYVSMPELLTQSDIITLHVPDTKETEHMINAAAFAQMKEGMVLVNTARGSLIDSHALLDALKSRKIAHALLDVLEHEQNFEENKELIAHPNVVTTPHIAFYADDSVRNMYTDSFLSIEQYLRHESPLHVIPSTTVVCDLPPIRL
ncbi:MAG: hydroxyacid dehydrogenase [Candidatus Peribacteraceae bacterium]|nr:hydroxyacid dehydrogenase [Candidatus Peribacteraceae bacterium]